ncbi:MAG: AAA family ATPase [Deltaproteobacteria bacterium]|nr:AAA family ATPase [Deltaproteobacteria bacterium]
MYLEDVTIEGFKSFSEKTNMSFQPGISVIIGNNGVGKSNILDAIVWALGESDLDRIRCYSAEEIFFAGSKDHPPASRAAVELTFRKGRENKAPAIKLRRQVDKNGADRFFIDDQPYVTADYRNKLQALNLNNALKTIIRQEQINDILLRNPALRLETICELLELESTDSFSGPLKDGVADCLRRYMVYLIPQAEVSLEMLSRNGDKGIEVVVTLPGNRVRRAHQLSGGEKAITSLALKLAVFNQLRNPFYLLDEVEPSLDYTHHKSMQAFLKDVAADTQLVMITHLRSTIELADTLHGVRTRWDGSSFMKFYFDMDERLLRLYKCC